MDTTSTIIVTVVVVAIFLGGLVALEIHSRREVRKQIEKDREHESRKSD